MGGGGGHPGFNTMSHPYQNKIYFGIVFILCACVFSARSPVFSAMFEHSMEESLKVS